MPNTLGFIETNFISQVFLEYRPANTQGLPICHHFGTHQDKGFCFLSHTLVLKSDVGISELPQIPAFDHFDSGCSIQYNPCFNHTLKKHTTAYPYVLGQTTDPKSYNPFSFSINETPRRLTWNSQKRTSSRNIPVHHTRCSSHSVTSVFYLLSMTVLCHFASAKRLPVYMSTSALYARRGIRSATRSSSAREEQS
ncbi:hypothetical protein JCM33374_g6163 [Metschnikowia sp. JCM 33374]|nr:hypothetical protein JCM33374_g6163 [Metschnikowia sp. JCM 33374]